MTEPSSTATALERRQPNGTLELARRDPLALGKVMFAAGTFPDVKNAEAAAVKIIAGLELGIGSVAAMTGIHLIEGKPVAGANVLATLIRRHPRYDYRVLERSNERCSIDFYEKGPDGWQLAGNSTWEWADAVRAEVAGKKNWKRYPRAMLFARAISEGQGAYAPDVTAGAPVYTPEELDVQIDEEVGEVAADIPPAPLPDGVASDRQARPAAKAPEPTVPLINAAQQRKLFAVARENGLSEDEMRAIVLWVADVGHTDRIPKGKVDDVLAAIKDHEAVIATIRDHALEGLPLATEIEKRFLGAGTAEAQEDPGPEPDQPPAGQQELGDA